MNTIPLLQVALDYTSLPQALVMASLVAPEVDIIEIGTPLCKAAGLEAIEAMREICPDKLILADFKTPEYVTFWPGRPNGAALALTESCTIANGMLNRRDVNGKSRTKLRFAS
jgi:hypothetical protein